MALIKCPECEREISSLAPICPHCGCVITVCPDCGAVYAGNKVVCDNCGCKLQTKSEGTAAAQKSKGESDKTIARLKLLDVTESVIAIFCIILLCISLILAFYFIPHKADIIMQSAEDVFQMKSKCGDLRSLIIVAVVFGCIFGGTPVFIVINRRIFAHFLRGDREVYRTYLLSAPKRKGSMYFAVGFLELPETSIRIYIFSFLSFAMTLIGSILLGVWAMGAVDNFWLQYFWAIDMKSVKFVWDFKDIMFILGVGLWIIGYVVDIVCIRVCYSETCCNNIYLEMSKEK